MTATVCKRVYFLPPQPYANVFGHSPPPPCAQVRALAAPRPCNHNRLRACQNVWKLPATSLQAPMATQRSRISRLSLVLSPTNIKESSIARDECQAENAKVTRVHAGRHRVYSRSFQVYRSQIGTGFQLSKTPARSGRSEPERLLANRSRLGSAASRTYDDYAGRRRWGALGLLSPVRLHFHHRCTQPHSRRGFLDSLRSWSQHRSDLQDRSRSSTLC